MKSTRRQFIQAAGTTGAALLALRTTLAEDADAPAGGERGQVDHDRPLNPVEAEYRSDPAGDSAPKVN